MSKTYVIGASNIDYWAKTNAKTLQGAKQQASKTFTESLNNCLIVAEKHCDVEHLQHIYIEVSKKYYLERWQDIPEKLNK